MTSSATIPACNGPLWLNGWGVLIPGLFGSCPGLTLSGKGPEAVRVDVWVGTQAAVAEVVSRPDVLSTGTFVDLPWALPAGLGDLMTSCPTGAVTGTTGEESSCIKVVTGAADPVSPSVEHVSSFLGP